MTANKCQNEKIMTLKEAIQKDGQKHLHVKLAITSGTTQYYIRSATNKFRDRPWKTSLKQ